MKILALLLGLISPAFSATTAPPYFGTTLSTTTGKATSYVSGQIRVAKSSPTADSPTITLDGQTGSIGVAGATVTYGVSLSTLYVTAVSTPAAHFSSSVLVGNSAVVYSPGGFVGPLVGNITGSAATAAALAANPSDAPTGFVCRGITADGTCEAAAVDDTADGVNGSTSATTANVMYDHNTTATSHAAGIAGNAATATALAANGSNCSAGSAPLGVDASGAVESCFDVMTQTEGDLKIAKNSDDTTTGTITFNPGSTTSIVTNGMIRSHGTVALRGNVGIGQEPGSNALTVSGNTQMTGDSTFTGEGKFTNATSSAAPYSHSSSYAKTAVADVGMFKTVVATRTADISVDASSSIATRNGCLHFKDGTYQCSAASGGGSFNMNLSSITRTGWGAATTSTIWVCPSGSSITLTCPTNCAIECGFNFSAQTPAGNATMATILSVKSGDAFAVNWASTGGTGGGNDSLQSQNTSNSIPMSARMNSPFPATASTAYTFCPAVKNTGNTTDFDGVGGVTTQEVFQCKVYSTQ